MEAQKTMSSQVIEMAREVARGLRPTAELAPFLEAFAAAVADAACQFERDVEGSPEMDEGSAQMVRDAFTDVLTRLGEMREAVDADDPIAVSIFADALEQAAAVIREAKDAYVSQIHSDGVTPWPFMNRLLVHLDHAVVTEADLPHTRALLEEAATFVEQIRGYAACIRDSEEGRLEAEAAVVDIESALATLRDALELPAVERVATLVPVQSLLADASARLSAVLEAHVVNDLSAGPTPLILVNLALLASERLLAGESDEASFVEVVARCRDGVAGMLGFSADRALRQAAYEVQVQLDQLLVERASLDAERLAAHTDALDLSSRTLAMYLAMAAQPEYDEEETVLDFVGGGESRALFGAASMPRMFGSLLELCEQYAAGEVTQEKLLRGIGKLESTVVRFSSEAAPRPGEAPEMPGVRRAVALLGDATDSLRTFAHACDRRALDVAASLMQEAAMAVV